LKTASLKMRKIGAVALLSLSALFIGCSDADLKVPKQCKNKFDNTNNQVDAISSGTISINQCAVRQGKVKCWGENIYGQLGLGDNKSRGDDPGEMGSCLDEVDLGDVNVVSIAGSNTGNRCALLSDGGVKCWGLGSVGNLGYGDLIDRIASQYLGNNLQKIDLGTGLTAKSLIAGHRYYCAILSNDKVKCWGMFTEYTYFSGNPGFIGDQAGEMGDNLAYINLPTGRTAKKLAAGSLGTCAILDDDTLYCWNKKCSPTSGSYTGPTFTCSEMNTNGIATGLIPVGGSVADVSIGIQTVCAVLTTGQIRCWGGNGSGELGVGDTVGRYSISEIPSIPFVDLGTGMTANKVSVGINHVCALLTNAQVKCWGHNSHGQLGLENSFDRGGAPGEMGDNLPFVNLGSGRTTINISASLYSTCALLDDHTVKCWGYNGEGRLGQGDISPRGTSPGSMGDGLPSISLW
jgi:alpha-tubulin suppressor-like RCC1 family protein